MVVTEGENRKSVLRMPDSSIRLSTFDSFVEKSLSVDACGGLTH